MSDTITRIGQNAWLWRAIIFKAFNGWFITVAGAVIGAHILTPFQESLLGCLVAGNKSLEMFMNQDIGSLKKQVAQALGIPSGNTEQFQRVNPEQQPKP